MNPTDKQDWTIIGKLRPRLHRHVHCSPQVFRGVRWYVLRDASNGRFLRISSSAYEFVGRLNGELSVEEICTHLDSLSSDDIASKDEVVLLINQLSTLELIKDEFVADTQDVVDKLGRDKAVQKQRSLMNPLSIRIPLIDPDSFLTRFTPWIRPLFCRSVILLWLVTVSFACVLAVLNAPALDSALSKDIIAPQNLFLLLILFIAIKSIHEFSHAFAVKIWGGEVHEMGITLLVFAPVPYVDASAAWEFRDKHKRILVSAIGIIVELFLASLAFFVWLLVEPGLVQDLALNAALIGTVSTLIFNANPLLRFDGYYLLQDAIEIPNLYTRSGRYYVYLVQRYLFGVAQVQSPVTAQGESAWFTFYGLAAFIYRMLILVVIVLFLAEEYLFIGVAIGTWAVIMQLVLPVFRLSVYLSSSPMLQGQRIRALLASAMILVVTSVGVFIVPVTQATQTEGVIWVSEQAQHYAGTEGFVTDIFIDSGSYVEAGTPVIQMSSPNLDAKIQKLKAKLREQSLQVSAEFVDSGGRSKINKEGLRLIESKLTVLEGKREALLVRSKLAGTFILPDDGKTKGRYLRQGDFIGYIFDPDGLIVKAVVAQSDIGLYRKNVEKVEVRLAENLGETIEVSVARETPSGSTTLPSSALGTAGGGEIAVKMTDQHGTTATEEIFQLELELPKQFETSRLGGRAYVRIDHGSMPLATQWLHSGRQLLLSRLSM